MQPLLGICGQQSPPKAEWVLLSQAGGTPISPGGMVELHKRGQHGHFLLLLKGFSHLRAAVLGRRPLSHLICFTFDLAVFLCICLKGDWCHKLLVCSRMMGLAALVSFLFLLWAPFHTGAGREVSERAGTAEQQSWAPAEVALSREIHPSGRKAEQFCTPAAQLHSCGRITSCTGRLRVTGAARKASLETTDEEFCLFICFFFFF